MKSLAMPLLMVGRAAFAAAALCAGVAAHAQTMGSGSIFIEHPWARATAVGAQTAAAYLIVTNNGSAVERLLGASTPVADSVRFHREINDNGILRMRELPAIDLPPGGSRTFKPSETHLMLTGLNRQLKEGQTFRLTLTFQRAGPVMLTVPIAKAGAMDDHDIHEHSH